jgi:hypothetical protein
MSVSRRNRRRRGLNLTYSEYTDRVNKKLTDAYLADGHAYRWRMGLAERVAVTDIQCECCETVVSVFDRVIPGAGDWKGKSLCPDCSAMAEDDWISEQSELHWILAVA